MFTLLRIHFQIFSKAWVNYLNNLCSSVYILLFLRLGLEMVGFYGMSRNQWASQDCAMAWIAFFLGYGGLGDQSAWWRIAPCCPRLVLAHGRTCEWLVLPFRGEVHLMQFSLQVTYLFAFHSDGEGRKRTSSTCSNESLNAGGTPVTPRRISWRQRIFLRVASPMNKSPSAMQQGLCGTHKTITPSWYHKLGDGMQCFGYKEI